MKYVLIVIVLILILAGTGLFLFIQSFDPDQIRPELERQLSQAVGARAQLGSLSVHWGLELGLGVKGLELRSETENSLLLRTGDVKAILALKTLLERRLTIRSFRLDKPEILVLRSKDDRWNWQNSTILTPPASAGSSPLPRIPSPPARHSKALVPSRTDGSHDQKALAGKRDWKFDVSEVEVQRGTLHFRDESQNPPLIISLEDIKILIHQEGPASPVRIAAHGNVFNSPSPNLFLTAEYQPSAGEVEFQLDYDKDKIVLEGDATVAGTEPRFQGRLGIHQLDLESVTPESFKRGEYLAGSLTAEGEGVFEGTHPEAIKRSVIMNGSIDIRDGAFKNINFVNNTLSKLTPLPALNQMLIGQMPPELDSLLRGEDTPFEILKADFRLQQGRASADLIQMKHSHFLIDAGGGMGLIEPVVDMKAKLVLLEPLSAFLIEKVKEMEFLSNPQGRIVIPFIYRGVLPNASVQPDLGYVAGLVFRSRGQELIATGLERLSELLGEKK